MLLWLITAVNILWSTAECREPVLHRVGGGKYTWAPNMNLTAWAMHEKFYVGDWLYFGFDKTRYNVLEVSKMNYNNCDDKSFITNITRGMKVAVYAQYAPPDPDPAPAPLVVRNGCPSQSAGYGIIIMVLALLASSAVMG
ncbi:hypothetical protein OIU76_020685 [Salix suchowensis]|nr:hypothetical protein OIU76_020685 [Salix suchowensis]